jgi:hypothetical protein
VCPHLSGTYTPIYLQLMLVLFRPTVMPKSAAIGPTLTPKAFQCAPAAIVTAPARARLCTTGQQGTRPPPDDACRLDGCHRDERVCAFEQTRLVAAGRLLTCRIHLVVEGDRWRKGGCRDAGRTDESRAGYGRVR